MTSHIFANSTPPQAGLTALFPDAVKVVERRSPGDPAELMPAESDYVTRAVPKRVQEFAAGRACARGALASFGVHDFALRAAADRQPLWPDGYVGSITHTAGFCAAAAARHDAVLALGLDSEIVGAPTAELWQTIARPAELSWVRALADAEQAAAITLLFSAKEAFYKCQYPLVGEWLDFHDLSIEVPTWGRAYGEFRVGTTRTLRFERHARLPVTGRYVFHENFVSAAVTVLHQ